MALDFDAPVTAEAWKFGNPTIEPQLLFIIDDHPLFREGLKTALRQHQCYHVCGESWQQGAVLALMKTGLPDVVLIDLSLSEEVGLSIIRRIREHLPQAEILVLSSIPSVDQARLTVQAGAKGYVSKGSPAQAIFNALTALARGECYIDQTFSGKLAARMSGNGDSPHAAYARLTKREKEIFKLVARGLTSARIADKLFLSHKTVENHRCRFMKKLGLSNLAQLVRLAERLRLLDDEQPI